ncbi:MAG: chorismate mutase [Lentisphaeria bacterium]|nr:chorismate mutase [Lentisphaeria bacterium]
MDITDLRRQIDEVDDSLIRLFAQRMDIAANIAAYKHERGLPVFVPAREQEVLKSVSEKSPPGLEKYSRTLYSMLFELSRSYQNDRLSLLSAKARGACDAVPSTNRLLVDAVLPNDTELLFKLTAKQHICGIKMIRFNMGPFGDDKAALTMEIDNSVPSAHLTDFLRELKSISDSFAISERLCEVTK